MPFTFPTSKVICPFCFEKFHIGHAPYRVYSERKADPDDRVMEFLNLDTSIPFPMHPVQEIRGFWRRLLGYFYFPSVKEKKRVVKNRICPNCHMTLPSQLANSGKNGDIIAVIGYRNTGKSNFYGVLIPSLRDRYAGEVGFSMHALDSFNVNDGRPISSDQLHRKRYGNYLYGKEPMAVANTTRAQTNPDVRIPMIYRLNLKRFTLWQRILHPFSHHRPLDLVLFDAAGEDLDESIKERIQARYLAYASGIIMLLDPVSFPALRKKLRPDIAARTFEDDFFDTFKSIPEAMDEYSSHYHWSRKIKTPVAVVISKFDELRPNGKPLEGLDPSVFYDHEHSSGFDKQVVDETSDHIYQFLRQNGINYIVESLDEYSNWKLFGMAALGQPPRDDNHLDSIEPINIADPLLWILYKLGHIAAKEEKSKEEKSKEEK